MARSDLSGLTTVAPAAGDSSSRAITSAWWRGEKAASAPLPAISPAVIGASNKWADRDHQHPDVIYDQMPCNVNYARMSDGQNVVGATAFAPYFHPIIPCGDHDTFTLAAMQAWIGTLLAASTIGLAVYTISYSAASTFTATRVAMLNAAMSGAAVGMTKGDVTTGAAGSGASTLAMDFTANQYIVGFMSSATATLQLHGTSNNPGAGAGVMRWTATALASATAWPTSFTQTSVANSGTIKQYAIDLLQAGGKNWM